MSIPSKGIVPIVVVAALVAGGFWVDRARAAQRSVLSGTFESQPSRLAPKIAGRVSRILVREGDSVQKGLPLLVLDARETAYDAIASDAQAKQAGARQDEVQAGTRIEEVRRQKAVVVELSATLEKLLHGALPEEIHSARARLDQATQRLLELRNGSRPEEIAQARAAVAEAQANLKRVRRGPNPQEKAQLQAQLDAAEADLNLTKGDLERKERLAEQGAIAGQEVRVYRDKYANALARRTQAAKALERAQLGGPAEETAQAQQALRQAQAKFELVSSGARVEEVRAAEAEVDMARANYRLTLNGPRAEDIRAARARLAQAEATLEELVAGSRKEQMRQAGLATQAARAQAQRANVMLSERTVYAPSDGVVERILVADGDLVSASVPAIEFSDPKDLWLRVYIPETALTHVHTGDAVRIAADGVGSEVAGVVESIATHGEFTPINLQTPEERGRQVFAVRIRLAHADGRVKAGMAATVKEIGRWTP